MPENEIRVCIATVQWVGALAEVGGLESVLRQHRGQTAHGFSGQVKHLASFMLAARERFGSYDSEMLAQSVVAIPWWKENPEQQQYDFVFPGLELY